MDATKIGEKIAILRKEQGMTQKELAEKLHVSSNAVSKWEIGKNFPDVSLMEPIAETLGISVSELLGLEDKTVEEAFKMGAEVVEEKKKKLYSWVMRGFICIILWTAYIFVEVLLSFIAPDFWGNLRSETVIVYLADIIVWAIIAMVCFRKLNNLIH